MFCVKIREIPLENGACSKGGERIGREEHMKTTIYLIRHGESEGNRQKTFLGHTDLDLTDLGRIQAERTAEYLREIPLDVIYSSDLMRAYHTALPTARVKGLEIHPSRELREIYAGEWEGRAFEAIKTEFAADYHVWLTDIGNAHCTKGESVEMLRDRILSEIKRIAKENEGRSIAVFTHATPIRVVKTVWDGKPLSEMAQTPWASNASVTRVEYENGEFLVCDYGVDFFQGDYSTRLSKNV